MDTQNQIVISIDDSDVATVEIRRPPNNFFDIELISALGDALEELGKDERCRAVVLCSEGKNFCAGANLGGFDDAQRFEVGQGTALYKEAVRIFRSQLPIVAAVQGAAIGGGLGLACAADFRIASPTSRFSANFSVLGFHQGFGLSVTLPRIVGHQTAQAMLYTGRRLSGGEALEVGLCDQLVEPELLRKKGHELAAEIAAAAPLAVRSIRETLRGGLANEIEVITIRENLEQERLRQTDDFAEGISASRDRRPPRFRGR